MSAEDLCSRLARDIRAYLDSSGDDDSQQALRELGATVARLTGTLLDGREGWSRYWWVDDLLVETVSKVSPLALELHGVLIWGDERHQWIDPFHGIVHVSATSDDIASYEFEFGDASTGLQRVAYGERQPAAWNDVSEWLFSLREGPSLPRR